MLDGNTTIPCHEHLYGCGCIPRTGRKTMRRREKTFHTQVDYEAMTEFIDKLMSTQHVAWLPLFVHRKLNNHKYTVMPKYMNLM